MEVLKDLGAERHPLLKVVNKIDHENVASQLAYLNRTFSEGIFISALKNLRIDILTQKVVDIIDKNFQVVDLQFTYEESKQIALAQEGVDVLERTYNDDHVRLKVRGSRWRISQIQATIHQ